MTDADMTISATSSRSAGQWLVAVARQRELSLVAIMFVLGGLVSIAAPRIDRLEYQPGRRPRIDHRRRRGRRGPAIITNVDLSVEAMIGLVADRVAATLEMHTFDAVGAIAFGIGLGLVLGMINGFVITILKVPSIVATLRRSRGDDYFAYDDYDDRRRHKHSGGFGNFFKQVFGGF